jgi:hypothetical protein
MRILRARARAEVLQWFGLLGAALAWTGQHIVGYGVTVARCNVGGGRWGISIHTWEIAVMAVSLTIVLLAETAAVRVLLTTRGVEEDAEAPLGRHYFFAAGATLANVLFAVAIVLGTVAAIVNSSCRQA